MCISSLYHHPNNTPVRTNNDAIDRKIAGNTVTEESKHSDSPVPTRDKKGP